MLHPIRYTAASRPSEMEKKYVLLFISVLVLGKVAAEPDTGDLQEDTYHTETHINGTEEEVTILDKEGHVLGKVDIFEDEGYQIDKPIDGEEHLCLLRTMDEIDEETNGTDRCYIRRAVPHEEAIGLNMSRILDHCGNRSIYILEPQDCDRIDSSETGNNRQKRSWPVGNYCCHYKKYRSVICMRTEVYCCRRRWGFCCKRCTRCTWYRVIWVTEKLCYYG